MDIAHRPERSHDDGEPAALVTLLVAIQKKDRSAFESLYDATHQRVYGLAMRITRHKETAEEVLSDVFMQVWRDAARFDVLRGRPLAWLMMICRSRALDAMRKQSAASERDLRSAEEAPELDSKEMAQDLLLAVERKTVVHNALARLDPQRRQLLALAYFRDLSHGQLAEATGLPLGTVKTQIRRGLSTLREFLSESPLPGHNEYCRSEL